MDPFQGIIVDVLSNGEILDLYDDPDVATASSDHTRQHYVEAVDGATFSVRVLLTTEYKLYHLKPTDAVEVTMTVDGQRITTSNYCTRQELESMLLRGKPEELVFTGETHFCSRAGQWMQSDYTFGKLKIKETAGTRPPVKQIDRLGTIDIRVQRVRREKRDVPKPSSMATKSTIVDEFSERSLKGRTVTNIIGLTNARPVPAQEPSYYVMHPIPGPVGNVVKYIIHYRSRSALQILGCIPRSPSPAIEVPDPRVAPEDLQQEVQNLRARLALLEDELIVKPEYTTSVKREREKTEADAGSRQRPRRSKRTETVDLTDD